MQCTSKIAAIMKVFIVLALASSFSFACQKSSSQTGNPPPTPPGNSNFAKGADVSWVSEMESNGRKFYNSTGTEKECMQLLKDLGMNSIRLRAWVNPANNWNNTADVLAKALRA